MASEAAGECVCAGQATHADPPDTFRYDPASHGTHDPEPFTALYDPIEHAMQAMAPHREYPMMQDPVQSVIAPLAVGESVFVGQTTHADPADAFWYVPASHSTHAPDPSTPLYVPAAHGQHLDPSDPSWPMSQMQSVMLSPPMSELVAGGHLMHVEAPVMF